MNCPNLGEPRFASPSSYTIGDDIRIPERIENGSDPGIPFELAGPRAKIFFEPKKTRAGIADSIPNAAPIPSSLPMSS
jgi:6-phosphofructokinase 1